jgi:iron complex transport system ATP-binding protein
MRFLEVDNINFSYGEKPVLQNISFTLQKGDFMAVVGPNGCGKTTLLHNISGSLPPAAGAIFVDEQDISSLSAKQLSQKMAFVSQSEQINFDFTVQEVAAMGRLPHLPFWGGEKEKDAQIVRQCLQMTNTRQLKDRFITGLSGGERQRVFIARALVQQPQLLLLDEPTSNLDIQHQLELMEILRRLNNNGMTVLAALHDLNLALRFANKALLLSSGQVIACGEPQHVLSVHNIKRIYGVNVQLLQSANGLDNIIPLNLAKS